MTSRVTENVKVYCRVRPLLNDEIPDSQCVKAVDVNKGRFSVDTDSETKIYSMDSFFPESSKQDEVFDTVALPVVQSVLHGFNGTIMAYGQTGAGKTYTMLGPDTSNNTRGVIPHCLESIFSYVKQNSVNYEWTIELSFIQIYCELILDLFSPQSKVTIRENQSHSTYLEGASKYNISSVNEGMDLIQKGLETRITSSTAMNSDSSRSHAILALYITKRKTSNISMSNEDNNNAVKAFFGTLYLVDLAGSERVGKSAVYGTHFNELKAINLSLSALGNCINALAEKRSFVPYRDSKLTRLLSSSLGGNSKTSLILCISPSAYNRQETIYTLAFGERAMTIALNLYSNEEVDYKALYLMTQKKLDESNDEIIKQKILIEKLRNELKEVKDELDSSNYNNKMLKEQLNSYNSMSNSEQKGENISAKWEKEIQTIQLKYKEELEKEKEKMNKSKEESLIQLHQAEDEWNRIESELNTQKREYLDTLQDLKETKKELADLDSSTSQRIAELMEDIQIYENRLGEYEQRYGVLEDEEEADQETEKLRLELESKEKELNEVKDQFKSEFESLDKLYKTKVDHLAERVQVIEESKFNPKLPPKQSIQQQNALKPKKLPSYMNARAVAITGKSAIDRRKQYGNSIYLHQANLSKINNKNKMNQINKVYGNGNNIGRSMSTGSGSSAAASYQRKNTNNFSAYLVDNTKMKKQNLNNARNVAPLKPRINTHW